MPPNKLKPKAVRRWTWLSPDNRLRTSWGVWKTKAEMRRDPSRVLIPLGWLPVRVRLEKVG